MLSNLAGLPVIWDGPEMSENLVILVHGAGAAMDTYFMDYFAASLSQAGILVLRFEFPYMAERRTGGSKRPPNTQKVLLESWQNIIAAARELHQGKIFIGGKSMGGRMASMIADHENVDGLICLGYPFYAPGKSDKPRVEHLADLKTSTLILQGERDSMGSKEAVAAYNLSTVININWAPDGDHGLKPRKKSGLTEEENLGAASEAILQFINK